MKEMFECNELKCPAVFCCPCTFKHIPLDSLVNVPIQCTLRSAVQPCISICTKLIHTKQEEFRECVKRELHSTTHSSPNDGNLDISVSSHLRLFSGKRATAKKKKKDKTFTLEMTFFLCLLAQFHGWYRKHRGVILYVSVFVWYVLWMWMLTPGISILQSQASVVHGKHPNFNYAVTKYVFSSCNDLIRTMA